MKNWITQVVAGLFAVAALASCEKDEEKAIITPSNPITFSSSASTVVLTQNNSAQSAVNLSWTPSSFSLSGTNSTELAPTGYQLQLSRTEEGFSRPTAVDAGTGTSKALLVGELNRILLGMGLTPGTATPVFIRVAALQGTDAKTFVSNPVTVNFTTYRECLPPNSDSWGLVGPAGDGWPGATATDIALTWDCDAKAYILRTALKVGDFKLRLNKDWAVNLGALTKPIVPGVAATTLKPGGEDMSVAVAGTYTVKLTVTGSGANVTAGTLTVTP